MPDPLIQPLTYSQLLAQLRDGHYKGGDVARDLQLPPAEAIAIYSPAEVVAALTPEMKALVVAGSGEMKAAGEFFAAVREAAGAPAGASQDNVLQTIKDNSAALDTLSRETFAALVEGGVGEVQVPEAVRPILREKVAAKLGGTRNLTRDQVKTAAGELMTSDVSIKALLDGHFGGGTTTPQTGQGERQRDPLAAAGFAFETYRI